MRGAKTGVKVANAIADKGKDVGKAKGKLKNADAIAEGKAFERSEFQKTQDAGLNVTGRNRFVPQNGKGNRTDTDQLIKNDDGTFSVKETKLRSTIRSSKGQNAARDNVEKGSGQFEVRTIQPSQGLRRGDIITVRDYERINKYD